MLHSTPRATTTYPTRKPSLLSRLTTRRRHAATLHSTRKPTHYNTTATTTTGHVANTRHGRRRAHHHHNHHHHHGATTTTTMQPTTVQHHHRRKTTMSDKISGAFLKVKGSLTGRPGVKAAGTRRMHGTDGRGSRSTARGSRRTVAY